MTLYESVFLVRPDARPDRVEELVQSYSELVKTHGGAVVGHELWGLRNLAFPIDKSQRAHYVMLQLDSPHPAVAEMEDRLRYDDEILRYLTIRVKRHGESPSPMVPRKVEEVETERSRPPPTREVRNAKNGGDNESSGEGKGDISASKEGET